MGVGVIAWLITYYCYTAVLLFLATTISTAPSTRCEMSEGLRERRKDHNAINRTTETVSSIENHLPPRTFGRVFTTSVSILLVVYWLAIFHYFERTRVQNALNACSWESWENWNNSDHQQSVTKPVRIAILADPQLVDDHTYPKLLVIVQKALRKLSDNYLHYNYKYLQSELDPDYTIFIGDLFDGGRDWEDQPWLEEFQRFNRVFPQRHDRKSFRGLPGNHDIGFQNISVETRLRFAHHFGQSNDNYVLGNHTFLQFDTISYSHEDPDVHTESRDYIDSLKLSVDFLKPRILLTHVPFFRDPNFEICGPGRESSKPFPLVRGIQYQTVLEHWVSEKLINDFMPLIIFSGDDHDYCDMNHVNYSDTSQILAREISCKSPSMTNGIKFPAYQLLSLNNPQDGAPHEKTYETKMCYLPRPYRNVELYAFSYLLTCVIWWVVFFRPHRVSRSPPDKKSQGKGGFGLSGLFYLLQCVIFLVMIWYLYVYYNEL